MVTSESATSGRVSTKKKQNSSYVASCGRRRRRGVARCRAPHNTNRFLIKDHDKYRTKRPLLPIASLSPTVAMSYGGFCGLKTDITNHSVNYSTLEREGKSTSVLSTDLTAEDCDENSPYTARMTPGLTTAVNSTIIDHSDPEEGTKGENKLDMNQKEILATQKPYSFTDIEKEEENYENHLYGVNNGSPLTQYNTIGEEFAKQVEAIELEQYDDDIPNVNQDQDISILKYRRLSLRYRGRLQAVHAKLVQFKSDLKLLSFKQMQSKLDELINYTKNIKG